MTDYPLIQPCATFEEWKRLRATFIGGSDIAAILGLSLADDLQPSRTIGEVWLEKVRGQEALELDDDSIDPEIETRFTKWGKRWEPMIVDEYADVTGYTVTKPGLTIYRHPEYPFIGGTMDAEAITPHGDKRIPEAKTTDGFFNRKYGIWGPNPEDAPPTYVAQVSQYLVVRKHEGFTVADLVPLIGGNDFRIYPVPYDQGIAEIIVDACVTTWKLVTERRAPNFDYMHKHAVALQRRIWDKVEGTTIVVPPNYRAAPSSPTVLELFVQHEEASVAEAEATRDKDAAKAQLLHIAGNNARVEIDGTGLAIKRQIKKGYHVDAYDVEPRIDMTFEPYRTEKRRNLLDEYRTGIVAQGRPLGIAEPAGSEDGE